MGNSGIVTCGAERGSKQCGCGVTIQGIHFPQDPFLAPRPDSQPADLFGSALVAPGATAELSRIVLGRNEWLRLDRIGQEILDDPAGAALQGFQDTTWSLRIDGALHEFYGAIVDQIGRGDIGRPINVRILQPRASVAFFVTNNSTTATYLCFGSVQGWVIPIDGRL